MTKEEDNIPQSIHLRIKKDFLDEIDQFTKEFRFSNRTDAMRYLMVLGLKYQKTASDLMSKRPKN